MTALFTAAMRLREVEPGIYEANSTSIGPSVPKVHGGAMLALCANAVRHACAEAGHEPVAVSASFLWAPTPGPMRLVTAIRKRRRRISVFDVELMQGDRTAFHAVVNLGSLEHFSAGCSAEPLLSANPVVDLMAPEPPDDFEPIVPGQSASRPGASGRGLRRAAAAVHAGAQPRRATPVLQMWAWPRGAAPDGLPDVLMCGDLSAPVTFAVERTGRAPTIQLTAFLRALPAEGWLRVICTCLEIGHDWFDEDHWCLCPG